MTAIVPKRRTVSAPELAKKLGVSTRTVRKYAAEPRAELLARAKARRDAVVALRVRGLSCREIGDRTGDTPAVVARLLQDARRHGEWAAALEHHATEQD